MRAVQTVPKRTRRTLRRRSRAPQGAEATEAEAAPLEHLRRRYAVGAMTASTGYLTVLITTAVRPAAMSDPVTVGLLVGFGTVAALCTLAAMLVAAEARVASRVAAREQATRREVDDIDWAIQFGARLAEAFPDYELGNAPRRGPSMR